MEAEFVVIMCGVLAHITKNKVYTLNCTYIDMFKIFRFFNCSHIADVTHKDRRGHCDLLIWNKKVTRVPLKLFSRTSFAFPSLREGGGEKK